MNNYYPNKPLKVNEGDNTYCSYVKIPNIFINTPVQTPRDLNGNPVKELCVPNFSSIYPPGGSFGKNICKNSKPIHLSFDFGIESNCYYESECKEKIETCMYP